MGRFLLDSTGTLPETDRLATANKQNSRKESHPSQPTTQIVQVFPLAVCFREGN